jgi:hypothetical protein
VAPQFPHLQQQLKVLVDLGIFRALASRCPSTATSLRSSKPTIAGSSNFASKGDAMYHEIAKKRLLL